MPLVISSVICLCRWAGFRPFDLGGEEIGGISAVTAELLTIGEVAERLGVGVLAVRAWVPRHGGQCVSAVKRFRRRRSPSCPPAAEP